MANAVSSSPSVGITSSFLKFHIFLNDYIYILVYRPYFHSCPFLFFWSTYSDIGRNVLSEAGGHLSSKPQKADFGCSMEIMFRIVYLGMVTERGKRKLH